MRPSLPKSLALAVALAACSSSTATTTPTTPPVAPVTPAADAATSAPPEPAPTPPPPPDADAATTAADAATADAAPATPADAAPAAPDAARGQAIFEGACSRCHPGGGRGQGPGIRNERMSEARMRRQVRRGEGRMPAFPPSRIPDADLPHLFAYLRTLGAVR